MAASIADGRYNIHAGQCQRLQWLPFRLRAPDLRACGLMCRAQESRLVESVQNPAVKHAVKLRQNSSYRRSTGSLLLTGEDLVLEVAESGEAHFRMLAVVAGQAVPPGIHADELLELSEPAMRKLTGLETVPRSMLAAEVDTPQLPLTQRPPPAGYRVLALDGVQDPGNVGTLLRTALAMGWDGVLLLPGCADPFSDKALRASRGAAFRLPVVPVAGVSEWEHVLDEHGLLALAGVVTQPSSLSSGRTAGGQQQQRPVAATTAAEAEAQTKTLEDVRQAAASRRVCLVLGSEGKGVSPAVVQRCAPVTIPMPGDMESLNVSASGAVLMWALSPAVADLLMQLPR